MRCLFRNMRPFKYAVYRSNTETVNEDGDYTGERDDEYGSPVWALANISEARGATDVEMYGTALKYTKTLVMSDLPDGFDENAVLWIDDLNSPSPDYVVLNIGRSLNFVSISCMRKDISWTSR